MVTAELPAWFATVALAEVVTAPLVRLAAAASGVEPPSDVAGLLADLTSDGVLISDAGASDRPFLALDAKWKTALLERLRAVPGGHRQVRQDLIRLGLTDAPRTVLGPELAVWAYQNADWASLSALWLKYPPAMWGASPQLAVRVFARVPAVARRAHPALTQAAAMTAALDPAKPGSFSEQAVRKLRQDGRLLHSGWASLRNPDSAVRAGSIWMLAQRTMAGHPDPLDDAWDTRDAISALIDRETLAGHSPSSSALTLFFTTSAATALLRGDIYHARADSEQAIMLGQPGDTWALISAGLEVLALSIAGNPRGAARAADWFDAHAPACGAFAEMATPYLQLASALTAIRVLDRDTATACLRQAAALEEGSEFWSIYAWIRSMHDLTWREPNYGLARFEAAVVRNPAAGGFETLSESLAVRARADLLCAAGRIYEAEALLKAGVHSKLSRFHLVPEARMHLFSQNGAEAIRVAEQGLHDPEIYAPAQAHLHTIRSAALLLTGAPPDSVHDALHMACTLCTELTDILPFVLIPADLRSELLDRHDRIGHESACILEEATIRERLSRAWANAGAAPGLIHLTPREELLLPLLATSDTADAIADRLGVSVNTVRKQIATLRQKFAAPDRQTLVSLAHELGLLAGREQRD